MGNFVLLLLLLCTPLTQSSRPMSHFQGPYPSLKEQIQVLRLEFGPWDWDLGLEVGIWASTLGYEPLGWDMGLEGWGYEGGEGCGGGGENFPYGESIGWPLLGRCPKGQKRGNLVANSLAEVVMQQVAQGQYVVSDNRCPALLDCELEWEEAGQQPWRGLSPVEHRGTSLCLSVLLPKALSGLKSALSGLKSALSGLISTLSGLKSTLSSLERAYLRSEWTGYRPEGRFQAWKGRFKAWEGRL